MNWTRIFAALLPLPVALGIGLGTLVHAHLGYPDAVYYYRVASQTGNLTPTQIVQVWDDPHRRWTRVSISVDRLTFEELDRDGLRYDLSDPTGGPVAVESARPSPMEVALATGGLAGLASHWYTAGHDLFIHDTFGGRQALRFTMRPQGTLLRYTTWIDARTHELLGRSYVDGGGTHFMQRYTGWARYTPNALPAGFFDPPGSRRSPWDRALGWAKDRLAGR